MDLQAIQKLAEESMAQRLSHPDREPGYIYHHGKRVAQIALQLRELIFPGDESYDDVLLVGGWFHDVGKGIEPHWEYGALLCREILRELVPPGKLEQIVEIVAGHTLRKQRKYPHYVQLIQDADILDHFGSQEIWLSFWHCAHRGKGLASALEFFQGKYLERAALVRSLLNYGQSVELFDEKDLFVRQFVKRLEREARGELVGGK